MPRALPGSHAGYDTQRQDYEQSPDVKRRDFIHQRAMELAGDARGRAGAVRAAQARRQAEQEYEKQLELERVGAAASVEPPSPGMGRPPPREGETEVTFGDDETVAAARAAQVAAGQRPPAYPPRWSHTTKARDERAAFSVQKGTPYAPGFLEGQAERMEQRQADLAGVEQSEQEAKQRAIGADAAADERAEALRRDFEMRERGRLDELARREQQLQAMSEELKAEKIEDPTIFTGSTGENILRGIGAMLIGVAAGASGDPMAGVDRIRDMAMDNVRKQKQKYERSKDDMAAKLTLYGRARERFGDERAADQAALLASMQMIDQEVARYAEMTKSPATAERARIVREELADQARLALENLRRDSEDVVAEQWRHIPGQTISGGGPPSLEAQVKRAKLQKELRDLQGGGGSADDTDPTTVPGYGKARSPKLADAVNETIKSGDETLAVIRRLDELRKSQWTKIPGTPENKEAEARMSTLVPKVARAMQGPGVLTKDDLDRASEAVPDPRSLFDTTYEARRKGLTSSIMNSRKKTMERYVIGYQPTNRRPVR